MTQETSPHSCVNSHTLEHKQAQVPGVGVAPGLGLPPTRRPTSSHFRTHSRCSPATLPGFYPREMNLACTQNPVCKYYSRFINHHQKVNPTRMSPSGSELRDWSSQIRAWPGREKMQRGNAHHGEPRCASLSDRSQAHSSPRDILEEATR